MESIKEAVVELELNQFYTFFWWGYLDLNRGPTGYEPAALTTELHPHARKNRKTIFESLSSIFVFTSGIISYFLSLSYNIA